LTFSGARWYMMTVRDTQMVRDQKKFENHCSKRRAGGPEGHVSNLINMNFRRAADSAEVYRIWISRLESGRIQHILNKPDGNGNGLLFHMT